jgi:hypothetical protein
MRFTSFTFLFLINFCSFGQEVELLGKYSTSFIGSEAIEFVGKDSFYFDGFYCTYGKRGKGTCEIRDDRLYLYFEKAKKKKQTEIVTPPVVTRIGNSEHAATINIECIAKEYSPLSTIIVEAISAGRSLHGVYVDSTGKGQLIISNQAFPITIRLTALAMQSEEIRIDSAANYAIKIFVRHNDTFPNKRLNQGETYVYEIKELSTDKIVMRPAGRGMFMEFKKMKE